MDPNILLEWWTFKNYIYCIRGGISFGFKKNRIDFSGDLLKSPFSHLYMMKKIVEQQF